MGLGAENSGLEAEEFFSPQPLALSPGLSALSLRIFSPHPEDFLSPVFEGSFLMSRPLIENEDFYIEKGLYVFTAAYLLKRGYCCGNGCRHCPYSPPCNTVTPPKNTSSPQPTQTSVRQR